MKLKKKAHLFEVICMVFLLVVGDSSTTTTTHYYYGAEKIDAIKL
jgi:hypothetical protein